MGDAMSAPKMIKQPPAGVRAGLAWSAMHARATFEDVYDERGTGHFAGVTRKQVADAIAWIEEVAAGRLP
jgi:hypothetical protein